MQRDKKLFNFFRNIADALQARNLMTKGTSLQKHEHSSEIKSNCYFWTSRNCTCYVFSTSNLILDSLEGIGWFADGFFMVLFLAMMLKIRVTKGSYLCKEAGRVKKYTPFLSLCLFFFFLMKGLQIKKIVTIIKRT